MSLHDVWQVAFDFLPKKPVSVEPVDENLSTDAGLLIFRQWDEQQQLTEASEVRGAKLGWLRFQLLFEQAALALLA